MTVLLKPKTPEIVRAEFHAADDVTMRLVGSESDTAIDIERTSPCAPILFESCSIARIADTNPLHTDAQIQGGDRSRLFPSSHGRQEAKCVLLEKVRDP